MNVLTIIIVVWPFFVTIDHVQPAKDFGHININREAILENNDETITISEEVTSLCIEQTQTLEHKPNGIRKDKERPAT